MSRAARSLQLFSLYLLALALVLLVAPNVLLHLFGFPATTEVWIRIVGVLVADLGVYYWVASATEAVPLFRASVLTRLIEPVFFLIFVTAGWVRWPLLLFGGVDALAGLWTWRALKSS